MTVQFEKCWEIFENFLKIYLNINNLVKISKVFAIFFENIHLRDIIIFSTPISFGVEKMNPPPYFPRLHAYFNILNIPNPFTL